MNLLTAPVQAGGWYTWCTAEPGGTPSPLVSDPQFVQGPSGFEVLPPAGLGRAGASDAVDLKISGQGLGESDRYFIAPADALLSGRGGSEHCRALAPGAVVHATPPLELEALTRSVTEVSFVHRGLVPRSSVVVLCYEHAGTWIGLSARVPPESARPSPSTAPAGTADGGGLSVGAVVACVAALVLALGAALAGAALWRRARSARAEGEALVVDDWWHTAHTPPAALWGVAETPASGAAEGARERDVPPPPPRRRGVRSVLGRGPGRWLFGWDSDGDEALLPHRHSPRHPSSPAAPGARGWAGAGGVPPPSTRLRGWRWGGGPTEGKPSPPVVPVPPPVSPAGSFPRPEARGGAFADDPDGRALPPPPPTPTGPPTHIRAPGPGPAALPQSPRLPQRTLSMIFDWWHRHNPQPHLSNTPNSPRSPVVMPHPALEALGVAGVDDLSGHAPPPPPGTPTSAPNPRFAAALLSTAAPAVGPASPPQSPRSPQRTLSMIFDWWHRRNPQLQPSNTPNSPRSPVPMPHPALEAPGVAGGGVVQPSARHRASSRDLGWGQDLGSHGVPPLRPRNPLAGAPTPVQPPCLAPPVSPVWLDAPGSHAAHDPSGHAPPPPPSTPTSAPNPRSAAVLDGAGPPLAPFSPPTRSRSASAAPAVAPATLEARGGAFADDPDGRALPPPPPPPTGPPTHIRAPGLGAAALPQSPRLPQRTLSMIFDWWHRHNPQPHLSNTPNSPRSPVPMPHPALEALGVAGVDDLSGHAPPPPPGTPTSAPNPRFAAALLSTAAPAVGPASPPQSPRSPQRTLSMIFDWWHRRNPQPQPSNTPNSPRSPVLMPHPALEAPGVAGGGAVQPSPRHRVSSRDLGWGQDLGSHGVPPLRPRNPLAGAPTPVQPPCLAPPVPAVWLDAPGSHAAHDPSGHAPPPPPSTPTSAPNPRSAASRHSASFDLGQGNDADRTEVPPHLLSNPLALGIAPVQTAHFRAHFVA